MHRAETIDGLVLLREDASVYDLLDEYTHVWNDDAGRGAFLKSDRLAEKHKLLYEEAQRLGSSAHLSEADELMFHRLELLNMLRSGHFPQSLRPYFMDSQLLAALKAR